jgi:hypothetical protein
LLSRYALEWETKNTHLEFELLTDKPKSRFDELVSNLRDRILSEEKIGKAAGWDKLLEKLNSADEELAARAETSLKSLHTGFVIAGTKDAFVYELEESTLSSIVQGFVNINVSDGNFSGCYPLVLSATELAKLTTDHELAHKEIHSSGDISLVFCAKRSEEDRVTYKYSEVTQAVQTAFKGFEEFIAVKRTSYQIFDVITLRPKLRRIEVLIDHPAKIRGTEISELRCLAILGRLAILIPALQKIYDANLPLNLVHCISGLYHANSEGRVSNLSFRTPNGSVNKGALPSQDLRADPFHKSGVTAVGDVTPYDVTISWDKLITAKGSVSVQIGMPISGLSSDDCYVKNARIIGARTDAAVVSAINKLVSYSTI